LIINVSNRNVNDEKFQKVLSFEWEDHQAPPIDMVFEACNNATSFLLANEDNVVAINCNHGKGRTGTIVCCMLVYCSIMKDSELSMDYYAKKRFEKEGYGVTQPCQIQYIRYFEAILKNPQLRPRIVALNWVLFRGHSKFHMLYVKLKNHHGNTILTTKKL
jgi:phosphatidylinositol-3,4,5-trisphosphate 3-phosphatase/dual-specificity protein phosphatase PTEN